MRSNNFKMISAVNLTKSMFKMIDRTNKVEIIAIHNYLNSFLPRLGDIMAAQHRGYKYGIIACYNGDIFKYIILEWFDSGLENMELNNINDLLYNKNINKFELKN